MRFSDTVFGCQVIRRVLVRALLVKQDMTKRRFSDQARRAHAELRCDRPQAIEMSRLTTNVINAATVTGRVGGDVHIEMF
jgi:hypothetical protein